MEKNKELILKYLADTLTEDEEHEFKEKLKTNSNFKEDFEKIVNLIKVDQDTLNDSYFINLLPTIRAKLNEKERHFSKKLVYGVPSVVVTIILVFLFVNKKSNYNSNEIYEQLNDPQIISEYISEVDDETKEKYFDIISSQNISSIDIQNEEEKEKLITIYDSILDDERIDLSLNDSEYNKLINELETKK
ncbi:hypothetical protein [Stygiobacter electus]|uniref:Uncharacterized protein n=1 Tax=Stygiobacter electus TaxID=3032292 RepID=A0AAE3P1I0_9BACT|nr:hypothetical protein [Stygiobacter electus]MDF1611080.1 hypothetical protein [Stygiobacter electus]